MSVFDILIGLEPHGEFIFGVAFGEDGGDPVMRESVLRGSRAHTFLALSELIILLHKSCYFLLMINIKAQTAL